MNAAFPFLLVLLAAPVPVVPPGAPLEMKEFRYTRNVEPMLTGVAVLTLDASILSHSSLDDLRLADAEGRQIPYILEDSPDALVLELPEPKRIEDRSRSNSRYRIALPYPTLPASRLVLETSSSVFERSVRLEGPENRRGEPRWSLGGERWTHTAGGSGVSNGSNGPDGRDEPASFALDLPDRPGRTIDLILDEGDNAPLPLGRLRLEIPTQRLRFVHPGGEKVKLLYGNARLPAPRYDLALIASQLDPNGAEEVRLSREPSLGSSSDPSRVPRGLFWGALAAAVAVLLLLLTRLLQEGRVQAAAEGVEK